MTDLEYLYDAISAILGSEYSGTRAGMEATTSDALRQMLRAVYYARTRQEEEQQSNGTEGL